MGRRACPSREISDQQKRMVKNRSLLRETDGSVAGPVGTTDEALTSLPVNDKGRLGHPATSSQRDVIISVSNTIGHECTTFNSAREQPMDIKRASVWRFLTLVKSKTLKEPEQHCGAHNGPSKGSSA
jgi:hypothetical protein